VVGDGGSGNGGDEEYFEEFFVEGITLLRFCLLLIPSQCFLLADIFIF
jgi:hypothetical protein